VWAEAVYSAKTYASPRMVEAPNAEDVKQAGTPKQANRATDCGSERATEQTTK
jgi:hypothetical protein